MALSLLLILGLYTGSVEATPPTATPVPTTTPISEPPTPTPPDTWTETPTQAPTATGTATHTPVAGSSCLGACKGYDCWANDAPTIAHDPPDWSYSRPDWMGELSDDLRLSELSIPGTHESMSRFGGDWPIAEWPICQSLTLGQQLRAGIRAFDIRLRHIHNQFTIHHGKVYQHAIFDLDVMDVFIDFLKAHPSETIIMRAQKTHDEWDVGRTFGETFEWYMSIYGNWFWKGDPVTGFDVPPRLGDVRGKIVILQDFEAKDSQGNAMPPFGIQWSSLQIMDHWDMRSTHESMNKKYGEIMGHINAAMTDPNSQPWYVNFTSGVGATTATPYRVAHGIQFPFEYCDGMNQRTYEYITYCYKGSQCAPYILDRGEHGRLGIIMMDFPGRGLIDAIIAHNGLPWTVCPAR